MNDEPMPSVPLTTEQPDASDVDAVIVGAGFSGLYQLHLLRDRLGLKTLVLERGEGVGGTWYWNRYPGARCDSESHSYSYYFSDELLKEWEWTERYPQQPEIVRYLNFVADKLDLKRDIQFGTTVTAMRYDESANRWMVETESGEILRAKYLITAVGCLSSANVPDIPGRDRFQGKWYHTGQWPHEGVDFTGKRVGQIGTGSTGIQAVPVIAEEAKHLTVFQRTANYSIPAHNGPLSSDFKTWAKENIDEIRRTMHTSSNGHPFLIEDRKVFDVSAEERRAIYEKAWKVGGLRFRAVFHDLLLDKAANDTAADFLKSKIHEVVSNPQKAKVLSDIDHPFATKRPPIDTGYFEAYNRDNVSLVNLRDTPIVEITEKGIRTTEKEYELDIIVFATGFDAMTGSLLKLGIVGRDGLSLNEAWEEGPRTYLGLQVAGFPNMFTITGPGSPSVLCNMPVAIEQHVEWVADCIEQMEKKGIERIEPTEQAVSDWVEHVNDVANATLLPQAGHSWYLGANVPGKPQVFMPYAGGMAQYRGICDRIAAEEYEGFVMDGLITGQSTVSVNA